MPRILRTNAATEDLVEILAQAARRSPGLAGRRRAAFDKTLALLSENPGMGSRRLPGYPDVRVFPCDRYLIFYRPLAAGDGIDLLRVCPASSDWLEALDLALP
jgi:plasmid stabilization system protein ParE